MSPPSMFFIHYHSEFTSALQCCFYLYLLGLVYYIVVHMSLYLLNFQKLGGVIYPHYGREIWRRTINEWSSTYDFLQVVQVFIVRHLYLKIFFFPPNSSIALHYLVWYNCYTVWQRNASNNSWSNWNFMYTFFSLLKPFCQLDQIL